MNEIGELYKAAKVYTKAIKKKTTDICDPKVARKQIINILRTTGDRIAANDEIEAFLKEMMGSCQVGAATGAMVVGEREAMEEKAKKRKGKAMSSWICYNKVCAKETGERYMTCVLDKERKEKEYYPKKDYWREEAEKGCPRAQ